MSRSFLAVPLCIALLAGCAIAPGPEDAGLAAIERACREDPSKLVPAVAAALHVAPGRVTRAVGRATVGEPEKGGLCDRGDDARRQVVAMASKPSAKASGAESPKDWLLKELSAGTGVIDQAAVARALEQREAILRQTREKRAGLPALPSGWTNLTGYTQSSGRINHILFTDGTGNNLLAGADGGGIWRSTNGGSTWAPVNDSLGSLSITNFAKATNDANTIYAGTNFAGSHTYFPYGVIKSIDGGTTWAQIPFTSPGTTPAFQNVQRVAVHPTNSQIVLVATNSGAYLTANGGTSWVQIGTARAYDVAFHPSNGNFAAIAYDDGTIRYTTTGDLVGAGAATATLLNVLGQAQFYYPRIVYAKSDVTRMYALVSNPSDGKTHLYQSNTSGASWTEL